MAFQDSDELVIEGGWSSQVLRIDQKAFTGLRKSNAKVEQNRKTRLSR